LHGFLNCNFGEEKQPVLKQGLPRSLKVHDQCVVNFNVCAHGSFRGLFGKRVDVVATLTHGWVNITHVGGAFNGLCEVTTRSPRTRAKCWGLAFQAVTALGTPGEGGLAIADAHSGPGLPFKAWR
jgi:hypothetical protein